MEKGFNFNNLLKSTGKSVFKFKRKVEQLKKRQAELFEKSIHEPAKPKREKIDTMLIEFSLANVAKATAVVIGLAILTQFLGEISEIIIIFFVSYLFSAALHPTVKNFEKYKIPKAVSILGIYLIFLLILGYFITQLVPLIAIQIIELAKNLTNIINNLTNENLANNIFLQPVQGIINDILKGINRELIIFELKQYLENIGTQLQFFAGNTFAVIKTLFHGVLNFIIVLVLTFFLTLEERGVNRFFVSLFPSKHGQYIIEKIEIVKQKVGFWLRGMVMMMILMFALTLLGLLILRVDYALTLALMVGIGEIIPVLGIVTAGIASVLVAFNQSPWLSLWVLCLFVVLQQMEGHVLVPLIMRKALGLSPIIIILAILIGYTTLGILGMLIAIPVTTCLSIFVSDYTDKEK